MTQNHSEQRDITVTRPYLPEKTAFYRYVDEIWDRNVLTNDGPLCRRLEKALERYLRVGNVSLTANGHLALDTALKISGIPPGSEIITTPFTFASTTHAIVLNGFRPVFCDVEPDHLTLDPAKIEALITDKTAAIVPVHVYGFACDVEEIGRIAKKYNLKVIYDAAHAFGSEYEGKSLAGFGDVSILSFHATKLFHTVEGGALVYGNDSLKRYIHACRNFGIEDEESVPFVGGNAKMNEFQAAFGLLNLESIDQLIEERKTLSGIYYRELENVPEIRFYRAVRNSRYNYAYLPCRIEERNGFNRDRLYGRLKEKGILARKYFYPLTSDYECYRTQRTVSPEIAQDAARHILCLPLYNGLTEEEITYICREIKETGR